MSPLKMGVRSLCVPSRAEGRAVSLRPRLAFLPKLERSYAPNFLAYLYYSCYNSTVKVIKRLRRPCLTHATRAREANKRPARQPSGGLTATVPKSKIRLSPNGLILSQILIATKTAFPGIRIPTNRAPRIPNHRARVAWRNSRSTKYESRTTSLTTLSPQLLSLPALPLWYSRRVICVPPIGHRAPAPARPMVREGLPPARTQEVILCAF
jgi:hypothetical protein